MTEPINYAHVADVKASLEPGEAYTDDQINEALRLATENIDLYMWGDNQSDGLPYFSAHQLTIKEKVWGGSGVYLMHTTFPLLTIKRLKVNDVEQTINGFKYIQRVHKLQTQADIIKTGDAVEIEGTFGYASVPASVKICCAMLAREILRGKIAYPTRAKVAISQKKGADNKITNTTRSAKTFTTGIELVDELLEQLKKRVYGVGLIEAMNANETKEEVKQ